ncbi:MAG: glycosyltransferase family 2 protein [Verrucomicrobia bacterium]|nr:glycosyltransferase family 2 protein [Verrucomicrobiota bacterium]
MNLAPQCIAVIPCHNEATSIAAVVTSVRQYLGAVLVVDDGSSDDTALRATQSGAEVLRMPQCQGKGASLRQGFRKALSMGFWNALTLDGDGQHLATDIPGFLKIRAGSQAGLIVGNRMGCPTPMPFLRRVTNRFMSRTLSLATGKQIPDTQCGFRMIQLENAFIERLSANRYEAESDQILAAMELDWDISFVPATCVYGTEASGIRPFPDTVRWLKWLFAARHRLSRIRSMRSKSGKTTLPVPRQASLQS